MRTPRPPRDKRRAIIIGGSMAGLFAALHLRRAGWHVDVYERTTEPLSGRGAGILTHPELHAALAQFGIATEHGFGVSLRERAVLDAQGQTIATAAAPQIATSWTQVHSQLMARFPADNLHRGADLVSIAEDTHSITAHFADGRSTTGAILIGADGVRSTVRRHLFPELTPAYAGYVAWRGLAPEAALFKTPDDGRTAQFTFCLPPGEQMLGYLVPGPGHDLTPGHRSYNFVWYRPADIDNALPKLLTDSNGVRHATAIPPQLIAADVIARMRADANRILAPWFKAVVAETVQPFLQPIYDLASPHMHRDRIALIGDAAFVVRPHVGAGVVKAADDAAALATALATTGPGSAAALAAFSTERTAVGHRMIAQARKLGSYLKSTYASDAERAKAKVAAEPATVLRDTGQIVFLRQPH